MLSSDFDEWLYFFNLIDWETPKAEHFYFASICALLAGVWSSLCGTKITPNHVNTREWIIKFTENEKERVESAAMTEEEIAKDPTAIEVIPGQIQELTGKWADTNKKAQSAWAAVFGVKNLDELKNG